MTELSPRDTKLVQYLNEAYGKEKELETALEAHIGMTSAPAYKRRLQQHLTQTKRHAREVERRIKRIGGTAHTVPIEGLDPVAKGASLAAELGGRAMAAAKGPMHALRGTGEQEKMLKNAKTEYADEHEEIATYTAIETLAETVDDGETVKLARSIRREEEAMARFLNRLIPSLTKSVAQAEIPAAQRKSGRSRGSRRSSKAGASSGSRGSRRSSKAGASSSSRGWRRSSNAGASSSSRARRGRGAGATAGARS